MSYTPAWLSNRSPGHGIFTASAKQTTHALASPHKFSNGTSKKIDKPGPKRTIAHRGSEIFVAVGKEIRWADLVIVKEGHENQQDKKFRQSGRYAAFSDDESNDDAPEGCRVRPMLRQPLVIMLIATQIIKTPVADDIQQLIMSPNHDYLAILTKHTVHIAILPDPSHLGVADKTPLRLKNYTLGPTTHVTSQSPIASALWHPLGVNGTCIVTVTEEAIVRVWELSTVDRWTFDKPTLVIDLKKLADGTSLDQDFSASKFGASKSFSPDSVEMEVAAACFGGRNTGGWSPMTLWVAMREGDVYALCPLLPEKWAPPSALIPSLSVSIVAKAAMMENDADYPEEVTRLANQQLAWMADLDNQEPNYVEGTIGELDAEVYMRPAHPGRIPKLQGPFDFDLAPEIDDDLDELLTDIYVIGSKLDSDALMAGEDEDLELAYEDEGGLSINVVCLLASSGRVSMSLDLDGVEAQWLPKRHAKTSPYSEPPAPPALLTYQVIDTLRDNEKFEENWPMFSQDVSSRYSFFITNWSSITFISLAAWVFRLEGELRDGPSEGVDFRLNLLATGENFIRERLISEPTGREVPALAACVNILDRDLDNLLLSNSPRGPIALTLENPDDDFNPRKLMADTPVIEDSDTDETPLLLCVPRPAYEPPTAFALSSAMPDFHENLRHSKNKRILHEPIRLSPATLTIFADAHKILSEETHRIGSAAAELFRRCEKLQVDLREQIEKANEVAQRVEQLAGEDNDIDAEYVTVNERVEKRIQDAQKRQKELHERLERIRKKASRGSSRELSDREKVWFKELSQLDSSVQKPSQNGSRKSGSRKIELWRRFEEVQELKEDIMDRMKEMQRRAAASSSPANDSPSVPSELKREKVAQVLQLIERETALVDGVKDRLERLTME